MIDRSHGLSITRQAKLVRISRGTVYYRRKPPCEPQVQLMHSMDACTQPRPLQALVCSQACCSVKGIAWDAGTCAQRMCITALYCKPRTSARHSQHKIYPYLLRHKTVTYANQVWAMDITEVDPVF